MQTINYYQAVPPHQPQLDGHFEIQLPAQSLFRGLEPIPDTSNENGNIEQSRGYFLKFCSFLSALTALCLFSTILLHVFCIAISTSFSHSRSYFELLYRLYGILFAAIGFLCEMEWTESVRTTTLLQYWTTRGLFYIFIALLTIQEYGDVKYRNILLSQVAMGHGILLIGLGIGYACMGFFCLKKIRDERVARYIHLLSSFEANNSDMPEMRTPNNSLANFLR